MVAGAVNTVPLDGVVMTTVGARLGGGVMVKLTGVDVFVAPRLSVALAVRDTLPIELKMTEFEYGEAVDEPTSVVPPTKYSTFATLPSESLAVAVIVTT